MLGHMIQTVEWKEEGDRRAVHNLCPKMGRFLLMFCMVTFLHCSALNIPYEASDGSDDFSGLLTPFFPDWPETDFARNASSDPTLSDDYTTRILLIPTMLSLSPNSSTNVTDPCLAMMKHLARVGSNFTHCMLTNARPFRVCEACITSYTRLTNLISDLNANDRCSKMLLMADKMQIITTISNTFDDIWTNADCDNCFDTVTENMTTEEVTFNFTSDVLWFQDIHVNISKCFNDTDEWDWTRNVPSNRSAVCHECRPLYRAMNTRYSQLKTDSDKHVCMDLSDLMNYTRIRWSVEFECIQDRPSGSAVFGLTALIAFLTVLLYVVSSVCWRVRKPDFYKTKRMKRRRPFQYGSFEVNVPAPSALSSSESEPLLSSVSPRNTVNASDEDGDVSGDAGLDENGSDDDSHPTVLG